MGAICINFWKCTFTSFIQGLSSLSDLATLVEAGLPNITGDFKSEYTISFDNGSDATGAFKTP